MKENHFRKKRNKVREARFWKEESSFIFWGGGSHLKGEGAPLTQLPRYSSK